MVRIITTRKCMLYISTLLFCTVILLMLLANIGFNERHLGFITRRSDRNVIPCSLDQDDMLKSSLDNESYWRKALHYNVDDYGVPVEEFMLSVTHLMTLAVKERLKILKERNIKTVLYYHSAYGSKTYGFNYVEEHKQGQLPYIMKHCKRHDCFCTDQRDLIPLEEFDAIVFYSRSLSMGGLPTARKHHQRYILWEVESPTYLMSFRPQNWNGFFNWTHTFRRDSDFWEPWGTMNQKVPFPKDVDTLISDRMKDTGIATKKTISIAWFVSNCASTSGRENYIKELRKYIKVDIYGQCGQLQCGRDHSKDCWNNVEKSYFFYFSAENSLCKDYITEKFFSAMKMNVIPIVFGGGDGTDDYSDAPKHSHINAFDYSSPETLAKYLKHLETNPAEYESYFWWKPYYNIWLGTWKKAHCEICDMLHENSDVKVYNDMYHWWVKQGKCKPKWVV